MAGKSEVDKTIGLVLKLAFESSALTWKEEGRIRELVFELTHCVAEITPEQRASMERLLEHQNGSIVATASNFFKFRNLLESLPALENARSRLLRKDVNADRWEETKSVEAAIERLKGLFSQQAGAIRRAAGPAVVSGNAYTQEMASGPKGGKTPGSKGPKARK